MLQIQVKIWPPKKTGRVRAVVRVRTTQTVEAPSSSTSARAWLEQPKCASEVAGPMVPKSHPVRPHRMGRKLGQHRADDCFCTKPHFGVSLSVQMWAPAKAEYKAHAMVNWPVLPLRLT